MSFREPLDWPTYQELYREFVNYFKNGEISEHDFRSLLAKHLRMNAVEIDREVELHAPTQSKTG